jgi:hypothetical protein
MTLINSSNGSSGGVGLGVILTIIFTVLKLIHVIDWSWWWVLSPLWIGLTLALFIFLIAIIIGILTQ